MIGQGVLRECLLDPGVERVLTVGRNPTGRQHDKLHEIAHRDLLDFTTIRNELAGYNACFFCLGITSAGMSEPDYRRVTYEITLAAASTLVELNPAMTFIFVSGAGADSSERGRVMWARVKGAAENAILAMPFKASYVFRPAFVQPLHGISSRTPWYNAPVPRFRSAVSSAEPPGARSHADDRGDRQSHADPRAPEHVARGEPRAGEPRHPRGRGFSYAFDVTPLPDRLIRAFNELSGTKRITESVVPRRTFNDVILPERHLSRPGSGAGAGHQSRPDLRPVGPGRTASDRPGAGVQFRRAVRHRQDDLRRSDRTCTRPPAADRPLHRSRVDVDGRDAEERGRGLPAGARGKRSAVLRRGRRDRLAPIDAPSSTAFSARSNTVVNVLLQEMERFNGVVIFATNLASNFDPAFERRIRTHVLFEMPGVEERERIWQVQLHPHADAAGRRCRLSRRWREPTK